MIRRLRHWWIALTAPAIESAVCPCGTRFLTVGAVHCLSCEDAR